MCRRAPKCVFSTKIKCWIKCTLTLFHYLRWCFVMFKHFILKVVLHRASLILAAETSSSPFLTVFMFLVFRAACKCNGHASMCNPNNGKCFCTTKGIKGDRCHLWVSLNSVCLSCCSHTSASYTEVLSIYCLFSRDNAQYMYCTRWWHAGYRDRRSVVVNQNLKLVKNRQLWSFTRVSTRRISCRLFEMNQELPELTICHGHRQTNGVWATSSFQCTLTDWTSTLCPVCVC